MASALAVEAPPELKQCSRKKRDKQCNNWIPVTDWRKTCQPCRELKNRYWKSENGKAYAKRPSTIEKHKVCNKRYKASATGKAKIKVSTREYRASDAGKAKIDVSNQRYRDSEKGKATAKRNNGKESTKASKREYEKSDKGKAKTKRYRTSDKGKAMKMRQAQTPMGKLSRSLHKMVHGKHPDPVTFPKLGLFADSADSQAHIESTFAPWMTWTNSGKRLPDTLPNTVWQIGHRVPVAWYRHEDLGEVKKCWSRANLFAQCAVENIDAKDRNILSREQWMTLKPIWPKQCDGMIDEEAWIWARDNVDNATRRHERAASSNRHFDLNATDDAGSDSESDSDCDSDCNNSD